MRKFYSSKFYSRPFVRLQHHKRIKNHTNYLHFSLDNFVCLMQTKIPPQSFTRKLKHRYELFIYAIQCRLWAYSILFIPYWQDFHLHIFRSPNPSFICLCLHIMYTSSCIHERRVCSSIYSLMPLDRTLSTLSLHKY